MDPLLLELLPRFGNLEYLAVDILFLFRFKEKSTVVELFSSRFEYFCAVVEQICQDLCFSAVGE